MSNDPVTPIDTAARNRIVTDLGTNLLVEAGAGSGKTYSLAARMAAGVATGAYDVRRMAAVTFTRKAAAELRGRFQLAIEERLATGAPPEQAERLRGALADIERFFAGTIHSFCARLLRERPVEAGMAPDFTEIDEVEDAARCASAWRDYVAREGERVTGRLRAVGVKPAELDATFARICEHSDVEFPPGDAEMPEVRPAWDALDRFWSELKGMLPRALDPASTCAVQKVAATFPGKIRTANRARPADLARLLCEWERCRADKIRHKYWGDGGSRNNRVSGRVKTLLATFQDEVVTPFLRGWRAHVYQQLMSVLADARSFYAEERRRANVVNYVDLLMVAARLLRSHTGVRRALQRKYEWLFIDEFQDTDPIQAEVFVLLAADEARLGPEPGVLDWTAVPLRPGALFVVGDPKQSIYRFRRADIEIYNRVRDRINACGGDVLPLVANFRSVPEVCEFANQVFPARFGARQGPHGPGFQRLEPVRPTPAGRPPALLTHTVPVGVTGKDAEAWEAERLARWIGGEVRNGRRYRDVLVLTRLTHRLGIYAAALERAGIPVEVSGAGMFGGSEEVRALRGALQALADPLDAPAIVGALRGPLFGYTDVELFQFAEGGGRFDLTRPLPDASTWDASQALNARLGPVLDGMRKLNALYRRMRRLPLGAAVEHLLEETGWLALASATGVGAAAGDLLQAIDRVREIAEAGGTLADAIAALDEDGPKGSEVEALPLEPGRRDVVRVMNLHKAKGLEAPVVVLADPSHAADSEPDIRIARRDGVPRGWLRIVHKTEDSHKKTLLGEPADWPDHAAAEKPFLEAEQERLFYVAATRARDLLVIGRCAKSNKAWAVFDGHLAGVKELEVPASEVGAPPADAHVDVTERGRLTATRAREARQAAAARPSWTVERVTDEAHHAARAERIRRTIAPVGDPWPASIDADPTRAVLPETASHRGDAGAAWGTLVHGLLEHAMRRPDSSREDLLRLARWLSVEETNLRPFLEAAVDSVAAVMTSPFWSEARAGGACHVEVPFAIRVPVAASATPAGLTRDLTPAPAAPAPGRRSSRVPPGQRSLFDEHAGLDVPNASVHASPVQVAPTILRGVIDLVYRAPGGWRIVDYKTDQVADAKDLAPLYAPQLRRYVEAWALVTGEPVAGAALFSVRHVRSVDG